MPKSTLSDRIDQGRAIVPHDLVLSGAHLFDLIMGALAQTDIAICDPHEMANMCGLTAIHTFQTVASRSVMDHPPND